MHEPCHIYHPNKIREYNEYNELYKLTFKTYKFERKQICTNSKQKRANSKRWRTKSCFGLEKFKTLIEKLITRALGEQQKNLLNIISGNFEIS